MPELFGQPRKDELRREIRELRSQLSNSMRKEGETERALYYARARIALMAKKAQSLEERLKDLLAEASKDIAASEVVEEARRIRQAHIDELVAEAEAKEAKANQRH